MSWLDRLEKARVETAARDAEPYRLRKQLPEPVFGQIKQARGFRQFLLRGFEKVRAEWAIVCTATSSSWPRGGVCPQRCGWQLEQANGRVAASAK
jgi:Transposase DDE domain